MKKKIRKPETLASLHEKAKALRKKRDAINTKSPTGHARFKKVMKELNAVIDKINLLNSSSKIEDDYFNDKTLPFFQIKQILYHAFVYSHTDLTRYVFAYRQDTTITINIETPVTLRKLIHILCEFFFIRGDAACKNRIRNVIGI